MPSTSTGLLVIRAYLEVDSPSPLRAEIRLTTDVSAGIERTLNLADPDLVDQVVRSWLRGMLEDGPSKAVTPPSRRRHARVTTGRTPSTPE
jgi:hypothetical protein